LPQKSTLSFNKIRCYQPPRRELFLFSHAYDLQVPSVGTPSRELFSYPNRQPNLTCELTSHGVAQRAVPCVGRLLTTYGTLIPTHISGLPILYLVFPPSFPSFLSLPYFFPSFQPRSPCVAQIPGFFSHISVLCPDPTVWLHFAADLPPHSPTHGRHPRLRRNGGSAPPLTARASSRPRGDSACAAASP